MYRKQVNGYNYSFDYQNVLIIWSMSNVMNIFLVQLKFSILIKVSYFHLWLILRIRPVCLFHKFYRLLEWIRSTYCILFTELFQFSTFIYIQNLMVKRRIFLSLMAQKQLGNGYTRWDSCFYYAVVSRYQVSRFDSVEWWWRLFDTCLRSRNWQLPAKYCQ